jgi:hypothetical protein
MSEKKLKRYYWIFKILSVLISCALPIWAVCEKFPVWTVQNGAGYSAGVGLLMIAIVLLIVFRRTVFNFAKEHFKLRYAPPITVWVVLLIVSYSLIYMANALHDLNTIFWMGFIGCAIGTLLTFIAENCFKKKEKSDE